MQVRLEQTGSEYWWLPVRFELTNTATGQLGVFRYNSWMNTWNSWGYTVYLQSLTTYTLRVHTTPAAVLEGMGEKAGGAYKGKLMLKLSDWYTTTDEVRFEFKIKPGINFPRTDNLAICRAEGIQSS